MTSDSLRLEYSKVNRQATNNTHASMLDMPPARPASANPEPEGMARHGTAWHGMAWQAQRQTTLMSVLKPGEQARRLASHRADCAAAVDSLRSSQPAVYGTLERCYDAPSA
jgi:hypothetical protein